MIGISPIPLSRFFHDAFHGDYRDDAPLPEDPLKANAPRLIQATAWRDSAVNNSPGLGSGIEGGDPDDEDWDGIPSRDDISRS